MDQVDGQRRVELEGWLALCSKPYQSSSLATRTNLNRIPISNLRMHNRRIRLMRMVRHQTLAQLAISRHSRRAFPALRPILLLRVGSAPFQVARRILEKVATVAPLQRTRKDWVAPSAQMISLSEKTSESCLVTTNSTHNALTLGWSTSRVLVHFGKLSCIHFSHPCHQC